MIIMIIVLLIMIMTIIITLLTHTACAESIHAAAASVGLPRLQQYRKHEQELAYHKTTNYKTLE